MTLYNCKRYTGVYVPPESTSADVPEASLLRAGMVCVGFRKIIWLFFLKATGTPGTYQEKRKSRAYARSGLERELLLRKSSSIVVQGGWKGFRSQGRNAALTRIVHSHNNRVTVSRPSQAFAKREDRISFSVKKLLNLQRPR